MTDIARQSRSHQPLLARLASGLTDGRCHVALALLLAFGFVAHLLYLTVDPPIGLSGDEAHYWHWGQHPDLAYYSKPPLVALIIRASTELFGDAMWAVRLPALVLAVGTSLVTYGLTRRLFGSARLALGTVLLVHTIPMFALGGMLMTIDPPFYFCFALATYMLWRALADGTRWPWIAAGLAVALGNTAKPAMGLWLICMAVALLAHPAWRRKLLSPWPWATAALGLLGYLPTLVWNINNDWVTFRHVARQTGVTATEGAWYLNPLMMIGIQVAIWGPMMVGFLLAGVRPALHELRPSGSGDDSAQPVHRSLTVAARHARADVEGVRFLLSIGLTFFAIVFLASFRTEIEPNWPAPAYFTLTIFVAWYLATRLASQATWKPVRGFFWAHVVIGLLGTAFVHRSDALYPLLDRVGIRPRSIDAQVVKMRGNDVLGDAARQALDRLGPGAMLWSPHYQEASLLHFYTPGRPTVFNVGPFLTGKERTRLSQFDLWPQTDLTRADLVGRDAVFVGTPDAGGVIEGAFESTERLDDVVVTVHGIEVRRKQLWLLRGYRGLSRPVDGVSH